jgi:hypothetical protein
MRPRTLRLLAALAALVAAFALAAPLSAAAAPKPRVSLLAIERRRCA